MRNLTLTCLTLLSFFCKDKKCTNYWKSSVHDWTKIRVTLEFRMTSVSGSLRFFPLHLAKSFFIFFILYFVLSAPKGCFIPIESEEKECIPSDICAYLRIGYFSLLNSCSSIALIFPLTAYAYIKGKIHTYRYSSYLKQHVRFMTVC